VRAPRGVHDFESMSRKPVAPEPARIEAHTFEIDGERMALLSVPHASIANATLTAAEHRVALEILAGRSNAEIASALRVSPRTVAAHVRRLLKKLGVGSRSELAARLPQLGDRGRR
jgi:DNA-binding CsgD family transcriptional regulator